MEGSHSGQVAGVTWTSVRTTLLRHSQAPPTHNPDILVLECMSRVCSESLSERDDRSVAVSIDSLIDWNNRQRKTLLRFPWGGLFLKRVCIWPFIVLNNGNWSNDQENQIPDEDTAVHFAFSHFLEWRSKKGRGEVCTISEASWKCEFKTVSSWWKTEKREGKGFRNFTQDSSGLGLTCQWISWVKWTRGFAHY